MFLSNNYPLQFIFDTIRKRLKILFNKNQIKFPHVQVFSSFFEFVQ